MSVTKAVAVGFVGFLIWGNAMAFIVETRRGTLPTGAWTPEWAEAIGSRVTPDQFEDYARQQRTFSAEETAWARLIEERAVVLSSRGDSLALPFDRISLPPKVVVLIGNRGGEDGFTHGPGTICADVSAFVRVYGQASAPDASGRVDRILAHEFTHLLFAAWESVHPIKLDTPLQRALWECFEEGLGNYRSLSDAWLPKNGAFSEKSGQALNRLVPILLSRLDQLRTATPDEERELRKGLSSGPFGEKWGALPVALWFAMEAGGDDRNLRPWVAIGPEAVRTLAAKHGPPDLLGKYPRLLPAMMPKTLRGPD
jgi:hypothetical protein